jgi:multidrug efflux pump subunit AcrA (membrane-fusion protein)
MEKKNLLAIILGLILVGLLVVAINSLVKKYENESMPVAAPVSAIVQHPAPINTPEPTLDEGQVSPQGGDNQFSTENGKLLR